MTSPATILAILAVDPLGLGGAIIRGGVTPGRAGLVTGFSRLLRAPERVRRVPAGVEGERLVGGMDLVATLATGRPTLETGLLASADGGALVVPMAERLAPEVIGILTQALDAHAVRVERDGVSRVVPVRMPLLLLDEAEPDEPGSAAALADRLAFDIVPEPGLDPDALHWPEAATIRAAAARLPTVAMSDAQRRSLAEVATACGVVSLRAWLLAGRAARAHAALEGREAVTDADLAVAVTTVIAPRAVLIPEVSTEEEAPPPPSSDAPIPDDPAREPLQDGTLEDRLIAAAHAALPEDLLRALAGERGTRAGRRGAAEVTDTRGRRVGVRRGRPGHGRRVDVLATVRAAAPWQRLRGASLPVRRLAIRGDDFRVQRRVRPLGTTIIVLVDASGSTALHRLNEAKGAVELLLAASYQRRDEVALVVFRGTTAELVLPPTRALARARRALAGLPGGGGTPLAAALDLATALALRVRRDGAAPAVVVLSDGKANITRGGEGDRPRARVEAEEAARRLAAVRVAASWLDIAPRPTEAARHLATVMGARYAPLPAADATRIASLADATRAEARRVR